MNSVTKEINTQYYLIIINVNLNSHLWLVANLLDRSVRLRAIFILFDDTNVIDIKIIFLVSQKFPSFLPSKSGSSAFTSVFPKTVGSTSCTLGLVRGIGDLRMLLLKQGRNG